MAHVLTECLFDLQLVNPRHPEPAHGVARQCQRSGVQLHARDVERLQHRRR
jgi:hypothetical protein